MVIFLFVTRFLIPGALFSYALKPPILWFAIGGFLFLTIGQIGEYMSSGNERLFDRFKIITKLGIFTVIIGLTIRVYWILKYQDAYVSGAGSFIHLKGSDAIFAGIVGVFFIMALSLYAIKYKK